MIRGVFYLILLCLGLIAAAIWTGQMHHLRQLAPGHLPDWSAGFEDTAGVRQGRFVRPASGDVPELAIAWAAKLPGADGLLWDVTVAGNGIAAQGELVLEYWPNRAHLRDGIGTADLDALSMAGATGIVRLDSINAVIEDLLGKPSITARMGGQARGVSFAELSLGAGPVNGQLSETLDWILAAELTGGASAVTGALNGTLGSAITRLSATIDAPENLPPDMAQLLQTVGETAGTGITIEMPVPINLQ